MKRSNIPVNTNNSNSATFNIEVSESTHKSRLNRFFGVMEGRKMERGKYEEENEVHMGWFVGKTDQLLM